MRILGIALFAFVLGILATITVQQSNQPSVPFSELRGQPVAMYIKGMAGQYGGTLTDTQPAMIVLSNSDGVFHIPVENITFIQTALAK